MWKCAICGTENREFGSYHKNLGIIKGSADKPILICIKCYNKGHD